MKNKIYWIVPENNDHITSHLFLDYDNKVIYIQDLDMNDFFNWKPPKKITNLDSNKKIDDKAIELVTTIKDKQLTRKSLEKGEVL